MFHRNQSTYTHTQGYFHGIPNGLSSEGDSKNDLWKAREHTHTHVHTLVQGTETFDINAEMSHHLNTDHKKTLKGASIAIGFRWPKVSSKVTALDLKSDIMDCR